MSAIAFLPNITVLARRALALTLAISLWGGMTFWYFAAFFLKPVRLSNLSRTHITVTIRNKIAFLHIQGADLPSAPPPNQEVGNNILSPAPHRALPHEGHDYQHRNGGTH
jgi:hypothetical protein